MTSAKGLTFPCTIGVKAFGNNSDALQSSVRDIVASHVQDASAIELRQKVSSGGKYASVTVDIEFSSRERLEAFYLDLQECDEVLMTL